MLDIQDITLKFAIVKVSPLKNDLSLLKNFYQNMPVDYKASLTLKDHPVGLNKQAPKIQF